VEGNLLNLVRYYLVDISLIKLMIATEQLVDVDYIMMGKVKIMSSYVVSINFRDHVKPDSNEYCVRITCLLSRATS
jgi:hypothetical protein